MNLTHPNTYKRGNAVLAAGSLIVMLLLTGCGRTGGGSTEGMAPSGDSGEVQFETAIGVPGEEQNTLDEELDTLVKELADKETLWEPADLMQDDGVKDFPEELIRQLQEALAKGTSDELLQELAGSGLRIIERADFVYQSYEGEKLSQWQEEYRQEFEEILSAPEKAESCVFYQRNLDEDTADEILVLVPKHYIYTPRIDVVVLERNEEGAYTYAGYDRLEYHRFYALFAYEGNDYIVCNFDDTNREVTKALKIFKLKENSDIGPQTDWQQAYLGRSSTDCELEELWTADLEQGLQTAMWDYMQQIGLDLMLRNRNNQRFYGEEQQLPFEERPQVVAVLDDAVWTPEHLGYSAQGQRWIFTLEGQKVYFALYYRNRPEQYLVGAFLYNEEEAEKPVPIALYGIFPHIEVSVKPYWDFKEKNTETVKLHPEEADLAFPEDRFEVASQLWRQVNEGVLTTGALEQQLVPQRLVELAREALFTQDWSAFAGLSEPYELTDHESALEKWLPGASENIGYINRIYQYTIGEDMYLLVMEDSGGSARFMGNDCYRLTPEGPEYLGEQTNTYWDDYVAPYEGNFYLVDSNYNFYSKYVDTIFIHPLTAEGISEDATEVSLEPAAYVFTGGYRSDSPVLEQIDRYVEEIQEELMAASPINDDVRVFTGCEEFVTDPVLLQRLPEGYDRYAVDSDNDGRLEYLSRHYWYPSNNTTLGLLTERYWMDEGTVELYESWEPECPYGGYKYNLIQLWYQEFEGKVYTFQLFLTEGYNYYLNVSLVEENQVSWIASYYVTPRCEWQIATRQNHTGKG